MDIGGVVRVRSAGGIFQLKIKVNIKTNKKYILCEEGWDTINSPSLS